MNSVPAPSPMSGRRHSVRRTGRLGALALSVAAGVGLVAAPIILGAGPAAASAGPATVTGVSVVSGPQGGTNTVTVTGTNLGSTGLTTVHFGASAATGVVVNANGSSLTAVAPANPNVVGGGNTYGSTFDITVNNGNGSGFSATNVNDLYTFQYDTNTCGAGGTSTLCHRLHRPGDRPGDRFW